MRALDVEAGVPKSAQAASDADRDVNHLCGVGADEPEAASPDDVGVTQAGEASSVIVGALRDATI